MNNYDRGSNAEWRAARRARRQRTERKERLAANAIARCYEILKPVVEPEKHPQRTERNEI